MSLHDLKEQVEQLTPAERAELAVHLQQLAAVDDPVTIAEITRRLDELETGQGIVGAAEFKTRLAGKR